VSGCSQNKSTKTENKEDLSWLKASIQDINKDVDKQVIQEHLIEMKDGSKETTKTVYTLNKDSSIVKVDSENIENPSDRMELVYHIKGDKADLYMLNPETKRMEVNKDTPLGEDQKKSMLSKSLMDEDISKYELLGEEKVYGKDVLKIVYHKKSNLSLSEDPMVKEMINEEIINKYSDLKKAVENEKKKQLDIYYYVDKASKKILCNKSDSTDFSIINYYMGGESGNPPVKSENKITVKTDGVGKIELPKVE